jgi:hypothetical protein
MNDQAAKLIALSYLLGKMRGIYAQVEVYLSPESEEIIKEADKVMQEIAEYREEDI